MIRLIAAASSALALMAPVGSAAAVTWSEAEPVAMATSTTATSGSAYSFSALYRGEPVRWNPCAAIHWRFNPAGAPVSGLTVVKQSVAAVARATGTTWVYDGTTTRTPTLSWLPTTARTGGVLIGWTTARSSDLLQGQAASVLAVTRSAWISGRMLSGVIALDDTENLRITGSASWRTVVLHELGHAVGLGHAGSTSQLMSARLSTTLTGYASGDLAGLARIGRAAGCL